MGEKAYKEELFNSFWWITEKGWIIMPVGVQAFFQGFNFDTLLALISCIASVVALFLGGSAYKQCQIIKNSYNDTKTIKNSGQDNSQKAGRDIINNGCDATVLATLTAANFEASLKKVYEQFDKKATENLYNIIDETSRIIEKNKINLGAYTKIDWINIYFEKAKNTSDIYMQSIWAKVLVKEMSVSGSFSFKTLDVLKNMTSDDFRLFEKLCGIQFNGCILQGDNTETRIPWMEQLRLRELGLINLDSSKRWHTVPSGGYNSIMDISRALIIVLKNDSEQEISVEYNIYYLSSAGTELLPTATYEAQNDYFIEFAKKIKDEYKGKVKVSLHAIIAMEDNQCQYEKSDLLAEN